MNASTRNRLIAQLMPELDLDFYKINRASDDEIINLAVKYLGASREALRGEK